MRSLIQWDKVGGTWRGTVPHCPTFANIYPFEDKWCWTVRRHGRNIVVGNFHHDTVAEAQTMAAKFVVISLLVDLDPKRFGRLKKSGHYTFYRFEPVRIFLRQQPIQVQYEVSDHTVTVDIETIPVLGLFECVELEDGEQPSAQDVRDTIELTKPLTADQCLTAGPYSRSRKDRS